MNSDDTKESLSREIIEGLIKYARISKGNLSVNPYSKDTGKTNIFHPNLSPSEISKAEKELILFKDLLDISDEGKGVDNNKISKIAKLYLNSKNEWGSLTQPYNEIFELKKMIESFQISLNKLKEENTIIKELIYSDAAAFDDSKIIQKLPVEIYLDTNEPTDIFKLYESVLDFTKSIGFDKSITFEAVKGSWFKRLIAFSKEKLSSEEVTDRLKKIEYGIEVNTILKQQSEIDKNQSEALANIITSLKDIPNAAIRIGALIIVKVTDNEGTVNLQTRTLSIKELHLLNKNPELLKYPQQILQALAEEIKDDIPPSISEN